MKKLIPLLLLATTPAYADIKQEFVTSAQISVDMPYSVTNKLGTTYSISGNTTLAFTAAPPTGTNNIYVVFQGKSVGNVEPGANSIQAGMISAINGGYKNLATVSESITVSATDNMMLCGPVSFTGTVTVNGTLTVV